VTVNLLLSTNHAVVAGLCLWLSEPLLAAANLLALWRLRRLP
jgi:hypothetical protein